jgi:hypothetical protein
MVLLIRRTVRPRGYASEPSLAAALPVEWRVLARRSWAGEKVTFLSNLRDVNLCPMCWSQGLMAHRKNVKRH